MTIFAAIVVAPVRQVAARLSAGTAAVDPTRVGVGLALVVLGFAAVVMLAQAVGPIVVSPVDARWLLLSPLDRRGVLTRTAMILALGSVLIGAVLAVLALTMLGAPDHVVIRLLTGGVLGAALAVVGTGAAVLAQPSELATAWLRGVSTSVVILAGLAALLVVAWSRVPGSGLLSALPRTPVGLTVAAAAGAAAVAVTVAWWVWRRLAVFPAHAVLHASARLGGAVDATIGLEAALLARVAEDTYWRGRRLRSRRWPQLPAALAVAWQEWRMLGRRPARLALVLASTTLPALLSVATGGRAPITVVALFAGALLSATTGTAGLRRDTDSPALRRLLGVDETAVLIARAVLPALLSAAWCALALELMTAVGALPTGPWWLLGAGVAPALSAAALRMAQRAPINHASVPIVMPMTLARIPTGWLVWGLSGLDLAVPGCAALLRALLDPPTDLGALVAVQTLLGGLVLTVYLWLNHVRRTSQLTSSERS